MPITILFVILFSLGIWGLLSKRHLLKKLLALHILNSTVIMLFIYLGSLSGPEAPIMVKGVTDTVDPLPQALMLTAIVVGVSVTALGVCLLYKIYQKYRTLDIKAIEREQLA